MVKLLTLNTHAWMEENPEQKLEEIAAKIIAEDYDVICLQEINQLMTSKVAEQDDKYAGLMTSPDLHEDNFALCLVDKLEKAGLTYYWSWAYNHIGYDKYHEGVAILSKEPVVAEGVLVSDVDDETDYHTRRSLVVETDLGGQEVVVASVHLSWWDKGFQGEWAKLEQALLAKQKPVFIMGDFNNPQDKEGYQAILASPLNLKDTHKAAKESLGDFTIKADIDGWEGNQQNLKVDYIFTNLDTTVERSMVVFDGQRGPVVSDHYGVTVELAD